MTGANSGLPKFVVALLLVSCKLVADNSSASKSSLIADRNLFKVAASDVRKNQRMEFVLGQAIFEKLWVSSPASTKSSDGLGPLYNARSCHQCHIGNGRGVVQKVDGSTHSSLVVRLIAKDAQPDPVYGVQLQTFSTAVQKAEGRISLEYEKHPVILKDGTVVELQRPLWELKDLAYGPVSKRTELSVRVAPPLITSGYIDRIPATQILSNADPDDRNQDGISGRVRLVSDKHTGKPVPGRFGWKAGQPNTLQQNSAAFSTDIGLSTRLFPEAWGDCTESQTSCRKALHGDDGIAGAVEVSAVLMQVLSVYVNSLTVPPRRQWNDSDVEQGESLFRQSGCVLCHKESYTIRDSADIPGEDVTVWSDLLLHDMGDGLADPQADNEGLAREWRTQPLAGVGLTKSVEPRAGFLHDGRARTLLEAVLWHGGEAEDARRSVIAMTRTERGQLIKFLESL